MAKCDNCGQEPEYVVQGTADLGDDGQLDWTLCDGCNDNFNRYGPAFKHRFFRFVKQCNEKAPVSRG